MDGMTGVSLDGMTGVEYAMLALTCAGLTFTLVCYALVRLGWRYIQAGRG